VLLCVLLLACRQVDVQISGKGRCQHLREQAHLSDRIQTLNLLSDGFATQCFEMVSELGEKARKEFRHKTFSVLKETASVFIPDGTLTDYILESYERGFLSVLLAVSYLKTQRTEEAKVELRLLDHELFTPMYNFGEDPANLLLSAILWERVGERQEARVDWLRLRDGRKLLREEDHALLSFAERQLEWIDALDSGEVSQPDGRPWQVYAVGVFPAVDWDLEFINTKNGYFLVKPAAPFLAACASDTGALVPTAAWFEKLSVRHSHSYHPLLHVQSWIRLPVGVVYSLVPVSAGAGVAVGGCVADAVISEGRGGGALCQLSIIGGVALMQQAPRVLKGALAPDLRHWERVPAGFLATRVELGDEPCAGNVPIGQRII
jgi:hypothetical protein